MRSDRAVYMNDAIKYLGEGSHTVSEVCAMTNFHSESYFRRVFREVTDMSLSEYKKGMQNIKIYLTLFP